MYNKRLEIFNSLRLEDITIKKGGWRTSESKIYYQHFSKYSVHEKPIHKNVLSSPTTQQIYLNQYNELW